MAKKIDISAAINEMAKSDPWKLRMIGRQAGLEMIRDLIATAPNEAIKLLYQKILENENKAIQAAKNKDQAEFDKCDARSKELSEQVVLLNSLS